MCRIGDGKRRAPRFISKEHGGFGMKWHEWVKLAVLGVAILAAMVLQMAGQV